MPKRNRIRARARRPLEATPPVAAAERPERAERDRPRARYRGAPPPPGGAYAIGQPSPTLERAAAVERAYVVKDFGRLGKVVALTLGLLVVSGLAVNALIK